MMNDSLNCTICLEKLTEDSVSALSCGHAFHYKCIDSWFDISPSCPLCRTDTTHTIERSLPVSATTDTIDSETLEHTVDHSEVLYNCCSMSLLFLMVGQCGALIYLIFRTLL